MQSVISNPATSSASRLSRPILLLGFGLGLLLSITVLSGDDAGRVNLFYLLLVYLFIPLFGALISLATLLSGKGLNFARVISEIPLWTKTQQRHIHNIRQAHMDKQWFFLQSQAAALAYGAASLLVFVLLLLVTDINFVWRSTLLDAQQILPLLKSIAMPWWFWEAAQPSIELLKQTQDSRLNDSYVNSGSFGQWWAFVLATQFVYSFLLRGTLLIIAKVWVKKLAQMNQINAQSSHTINPVKVPEHQHSLSPITHMLPRNYALGNWAGISSNILTQLTLSATKSLKVGPLVPEHEISHFDGPQVLLVKAWEPPMGELQDYLEQHQGLLYPLNYKGNKLLPPSAIHLEEWQRFTAKIHNWGVYQAPTLGEKNAE